MRALLLLSTQAGAGRTLLAANLAQVLAESGGQPVWLVERTADLESELALHRGESPQMGGVAPGARPAVWHTCLSDPKSLATELNNLRQQPGWVLVDGSSLDQTDWRDWASACGKLLLVERADLSGCRRMQRLLKAAQEAHWPLASLLPVWMGEQAVQPLPSLPEKAALSVPWHAKATERLASASLPALDEPKSAFVQAIRRLALALPELTPLSKGNAAPLGEALGTEAPVLERLRLGLRQRLDLAATDGSGGGNGDFKAQWEPKVRAAASQLLALETAAWLDQAKRAQLIDRMVQETLGLGPLEDLLADPEISEIMVNHPSQVYVERAGRLSLSPVRFEDARQLRSVIERMVAPLGRRIDESSPKVDARLPDGSRVNAIIPPLAVKGPCLTIRKFPSKRLGMDELVARGALTPVSARFLRQAVESRQNILVSGGTGSGKTTLLNALSAYIPEGERIVTIEDSAELKLQQPHVVTLEARPANLEGHGEVSIRDLLVNSLRMRPDRIVVGECRGGEALDMLQAMNTGHTVFPMRYLPLHPRPSIQGKSRHKPLRYNEKRLLHRHGYFKAPWNPSQPVLVSAKQRDLPQTSEAGALLGVHGG